MNLGNEAFIEPVHDMIVVRMSTEHEVTTKGGLVLPTATQTRPTFMGVVMDVGPGRLTPSGERRVEMCVQKGDKILFRRGADVEFSIAGETRIIIREPDVIGKVKTIDVRQTEETPVSLR